MLTIKNYILCAALLVTNVSAFADSSNSFELGTGIGATEEGDDRQRPAALFHLGIGSNFYGRGYIYGRKFGPITERTSLVSLNYRFPIFSKSMFYGSVGGSLLLEETIVEAEEDSGDKDLHERRYNLGSAFGIGYMIPFKPFYLCFSWDSHLYMAGTAALFLVTARKQFISIGSGITF